ncbi:MAG: helix-turn-helix domain-containing protein [Deltaproteobacteria bacterium]|nr:helix-turn-helix domain-containing protein [Deltaproteobacteria bacterium]
MARSGERDYGSQALEKGLRVVHVLCVGDILRPKSLKEVADAAGVTTAEAHGALHTLVKLGLARRGQDGQGFRAAPEGWVQYALAAQECLLTYAAELGLNNRPQLRVAP